MTDLPNTADPNADTRNAPESAPLSPTSAPPPVVDLSADYRSAVARKTSCTLINLLTIRTRSGLKRAHIADITKAAGRQITEDRQQKLEVGPIRSEPWYDEARDLSRILLLDGILPLMSELYREGYSTFPSGHLTTFSVGHPLENDRDMLTNGVRLPLSLACRIAIDMGLDDPIELEQSPRLVEAWAALASGERFGRLGTCPWCGGNTTRDPGSGHYIAAQPHLPTCFVDGVLAPRYDRPHLTGAMPRPRSAGTRGTARLAGDNLRALRKARRLTQKQLAEAVGIGASYLARIEQRNVALTEPKAHALAQFYGVPVGDLYA